MDRWNALTRGQWTVVDSALHDGRRLLLAAPKEPGASRRRALSPRERQVAQFAAQGRGIEEIAYALGIASNTVGTHLASAMRKLRARPRAELVTLLG